MGETYSNSELRDIAEELVEDLRDMDEGDSINTWQLVEESGYEPDEMDERSLVHLNNEIFKVAKRKKIVLDIAAHKEMEKGHPFNSDYIVHNKNAQIKCPYCGSTNTARIIYGYPLFSEKMQKNLDKGKWTLGGCGIDMVEIDGEHISLDPGRKCNDCKKRFATNPVLITPGKGNAEDYRDIVTSITFKRCLERDYGLGTSVELKRNTKGALVHVKYDILSRGYFENPVNDKQITEARWYKILDKLYCDMYLHEWKKKYDCKGSGYVVIDGERWTLDIRMTGGRKRSYSGINAYPPYWDELVKIFRSFARI